MPTEHYTNWEAADFRDLDGNGVQELSVIARVFQGRHNKMDHQVLRYSSGEWTIIEINELGAMAGFETELQRKHRAWVDFDSDGDFDLLIWGIRSIHSNSPYENHVVGISYELHEPTWSIARFGDANPGVSQFKTSEFHAFGYVAPGSRNLTIQGKYKPGLAGVVLISEDHAIPGQNFLTPGYPLHVIPRQEFQHFSIRPIFTNSSGKFWHTIILPPDTFYRSATGVQLFVQVIYFDSSSSPIGLQMTERLDLTLGRHPLTP